MFSRPLLYTFPSQVPKGLKLSSYIQVFGVHVLGDAIRSPSSETVDPARGQPMPSVICASGSGTRKIDFLCWPEISTCIKTQRTANILRGPKVHIYTCKGPRNLCSWNPPCLGPWNQNAGSLRLCGLWSPYAFEAYLKSIGNYGGLDSSWPKHLPHLHRTLDVGRRNDTCFGLIN